MARRYGDTRRRLSVEHRMFDGVMNVVFSDPNASQPPSDAECLLTKVP